MSYTKTLLMTLFFLLLNLLHAILWLWVWAITRTQEYHPFVEKFL